MHPRQLEGIPPLHARLQHRAVPLPAPAPARTMPGRQNWPLYLFLFLLPLQNIQTGYLPNLGGGINFLNVMTLLSLLGAWRCGGRLTRGTGVNGWMLIYAVWSVAALFIGYGSVQSETEVHANALKDHLTGLFVMLLVQWSVTDWRAWRRIFLVTLAPLPYIAKVVWAQHSSAVGYHYDDDLRIQGTFSLLGANEFAAFCVTTALVTLGFLLAARTNRKWKFVLLVALACALLGIVYSYSRGAYITILLGVVLMLLLWRGRLRAVLPAIFLAIVLPLTLPVSVIERFESASLSSETRDESTASRFAFWDVAWDVFTRHPIAGSGYHTFHHKELNPFGMDAHNFFMRELTEKGIVGFAIVVALMLSVFAVIRRVLRAYPGGQLPHGLALGMAGAWLALIAGSCFGDRFTYYPMVAFFWAYTGLLLASIRLHDQGQGADAT